LTFSVLLFLLLSVSVTWVSAADEDQVSLGLANAEGDLASAYDAVLEAEEAGADVSGLLDMLNVGGEYLAEAYVWQRLGVNENATRLAGLCQEAVENVRSEAILLKEKAERLEASDFMVTMLVSAVGVGVVVVVGFVLWRVFTRRYSRRILGLKPEVVSGES
jgi:hypothetical protein